MELNLNHKSKSEFQHKFRQLINNSIESSLVAWGDRFNSYYLNAIQLGYAEFDLMFEKLYGLRYKENHELFSDLFKRIALYHEKGELDLELALSEFFEKLFVRLFRMLNPNFQFQLEYVLCISQTIKGFESFGEIHKDLLTKLKQQLGATRTFVQGLFAGAAIIGQLNRVRNGFAAILTSDNSLNNSSYFNYSDRHKQQLWHRPHANQLLFSVLRPHQSEAVQGEL